MQAGAAQDRKVFDFLISSTGILLISRVQTLWETR
jgi:hypothetical protein